MQKRKSMAVAYVIWFFLGGLGMHRFYLGRPNSGAAMLVLAFFGYATIWLFGMGLMFLIPLALWLLLDMFLIPAMIAAANSKGMATYVEQAGMLSTGGPSLAGHFDELQKLEEDRDSGRISESEYASRRQVILTNANL